MVSMMRWPRSAGSILLLILVVVSAGCPDSGAGGQRDALGEEDGGATDQGQPQGDLQPSDLELADQAPPGIGCLDILDCWFSCKGDKTCIESCTAEGTPTAQALIQALRDCDEAATTGACKDECAAGVDQACVKCRNAACTPEMDACNADMGPVMPGMGDLCNEQLPCTAPLGCVDLWGQNQGYCTRRCYRRDVPCSGGPGATLALCNLVDSKTKVDLCGFVCKLGGESHPCPEGLVCGAQPDPPGSDQYLCEPK